jgi:hypothetical protein
MVINLNKFFFSLDPQKNFFFFFFFLFFRRAGANQLWLRVRGLNERNKYFIAAGYYGSRSVRTAGKTKWLTFEFEFLVKIELGI